MGDYRKEKIIIKKSPTADTRTCDFTKVSEEQLLQSSLMHIQDVKTGMFLMSEVLKQMGAKHDFTKLQNIKEFHHDFQTGFKEETWYKMHKQVERHHLQDADGVRDDVDLLDVIECIVDGVMAGMARSGEFKDVVIPNEVLQKAVSNTANNLKKMILVEEE